MPGNFSVHKVNNEYLLDRMEQILQRLEAMLGANAPGPAWDVSSAFKWKSTGGSGFLQTVNQLSSISLADLRHIDRQKAVLDRNTRQFVAGLPANNALLWGPRGTGKSSLIQALLNQYASAGLRVIEVEKRHLADLPQIVGLLAARPEKFIIYCDDLSFEENNHEYLALKVILDGSISHAPENVTVYATSNRRHLVPEYHSDNLDARTSRTEIHYSDAVEEKISLSERFGLWVAFHPFTQDQYLDIVTHWLQAFGVHNADDETRAAALRWALARGSRSGRSAYQFARDWAGRQGLNHG